MSENIFLDIKTQSSVALLSTNLLSKLRKDILTGKYEHGYKLTEQHICSVYRISRTPVREALKQLEMEGLIEMIPNRGAFVLGFSAQDIRDMFDLRKSYEIQAVKWAIERITDEELDSLGETFEFMEFYTQKNDIEKMLNINMTFHQLIYTASHNRMLQNILSSYQMYIKYTKYAKKIHTFSSGYLPTLLEEHREIYEAFQNKDISLGAKAIEKHMDNSIERCYLKNL